MKIQIKTNRQDKNNIKNYQELLKMVKVNQSKPDSLILNKVEHKILQADI